jgi:predicted aconitase
MSTATALQLTAEEEAMLAGEMGIAAQGAMEIVTALANIYGASHLVPVRSVQVAGVSYKNLGQAGLEFLCGWAEQGARVAVPTTLNPAGMDLDQWQELGFSAQFAQNQLKVVQAYQAMGIQPLCTCTPYLAGNIPSMGDHVAWAESSAVTYANSVLGARTNREGGPSALAAAITGRTAAYGLHLSESRLASHLVDVRCPLRTQSDWGALGYIVGQRVRNGIPYFVLDSGIDNGDQVRLLDCLKSLGAAMAASGAVALYHVESLTPEAKQSDMLAPGAPRIEIDSLQQGYRALNARSRRVDLVSIGCPHASAQELEAVVDLLHGRQVTVPLWITTSRETYNRARSLVKAVRAAGGRVVCDTCMVVAPVEELGYRSMATNSAKMAFYTPSHSGLQVHFGTLAQCIDAAVSGRWATQT